MKSPRFWAGTLKSGARGQMAKRPRGRTERAGEKQPPGCCTPKGSAGQVHPGKSTARPGGRWRSSADRRGSTGQAPRPGCVGGGWCRGEKRGAVASWNQEGTWPESVTAPDKHQVLSKHQAQRARRGWNETREPWTTNGRRRRRIPSQVVGRGPERAVGVRQGSPVSFRPDGAWSRTQAWVRRPEGAVRGGPAVTLH